MPAKRSSSGQLGLHLGGDQLELLGGPDPFLQLERRLEEEAVRVDLGGVGDQGAVTDLEVVAARHPGGDPGVVGGVRLPLLQALGERRLDARGEHRLVQREGAGPVEAVLVVDLQHLPRLPRLGEALRVGRRLERGHRDVVAHDVVGVGVAAVLVVRREHVRPEAADQPDQRLGRDLRVHQPETALRERRLGVALGPAGVDEPEPVLAYAEDLASRLHLLSANGGHVREHVGAIHLRVQDRAALATRAGDHVHVDPLRDVPGRGGSALARLVVGMGVHVHQAEHAAKSRDAARWKNRPGDPARDASLDAGRRRDGRPLRRHHACPSPCRDPGVGSRRGGGARLGRVGGLVPEHSRGAVDAAVVRRRRRPLGHREGGGQAA